MRERPLLGAGDLLPEVLEEHVGVEPHEDERDAGGQEAQARHGQQRPQARALVRARLGAGTAGTMNKVSLMYGSTQYKMTNKNVVLRIISLLMNV